MVKFAEAGSGPHDGPKCACRHDGIQWTARCAASQAYSDDVARRWAAEHIRVSPNTTFTPEYRAFAAKYLYPNNEDLL